MAAPELWDAEQAAAFLGATSAASARHTLSSWGVAAVGYERNTNGRPTARYGADEVRQAAAARPGRGARTDLPENGRRNAK